MKQYEKLLLSIVIFEEMEIFMTVSLEQKENGEYEAEFEDSW